MSEPAKKLLAKMKQKGWTFGDVEWRYLQGKFSGEEKEAALELIKIYRD